jgi:hypothetical protein
MISTDLNTSITAVIGAGAALSGVVRLGVETLVGISMPAAWTAADLTFQVSPDDGQTFGEAQDGANNAIDLKVAAGQYIQIDPKGWRGVNCLKIRSGTLAVPVNQGAQATIILHLRSVF